MRRTAAVALCLALAATGACTKHKAAAPDPGIEGVETFPDLKHTHVAGPVTYPNTPPVGGPHNPVWLACGVYAEPIPNQHAVHSMEHGAVWVTYRPDLPQQDVDAVHRLQALKPSFVLESPYDGLPAPIVASAWGLQLKVEKADDPRLAEFVRKYAGGPQGGEGPNVRCIPGASLTQVRAIDAREASASPSPAAS
jgi:hypothetical protein